MITHLRQKLQETEKELAATAEKAAGLAQRLEDRTAQHDQLQKLECQAERILATLTDESERATSLDLHNVLVQKYVKWPGFNCIHTDSGQVGASATLSRVV